ncbi:carboxylating nicotinate-nucleotide diphosphorylase [bacterium]|nr:carboxylating nicotinate-nucleotide diphosphorylase [bacterium]
MADLNFKVIRDDATTLHVIECALAEDIGAGDVTTRHLVPDDLLGRGHFLAKQDLVLCGLGLVEFILERVDGRISFMPELEDGIPVPAGTRFGRLTGPFGSLLTAERTVLNFLTHLSGIATLTAQYVNRVEGTSAKIYDTRKTMPGLRLLEKYAVAAGGGQNHRIGLFDAILIKNNHLATGKSIGQLVKEAKERALGAAFIEVEVGNMSQVSEAVAAGPDIIMLDNMDLEQIEQARAIIPARIAIEVSGNVTLETVREIARCGVDRISVGALTHSAPAADLSLRIQPDHAH